MLASRELNHSFLLAILIALSLVLIGTLAQRALTHAPSDTNVALASHTTPSVEATIQEDPIPEHASYIEVVGGCNANHEGTCVTAHTHPSASARVITSLRTGVVLKIGGVLVNENEVWYRVVFDEWLRYPGRLTQSEWYVRAQNDVRMFEDVGLIEHTPDENVPEELGKYIVVDRSTQSLFAYENDELVFTQPVSSGLLATPTPRGTFTIFKKTPTRYMQGPLPGISTKYFDLPGVPWNLYFTHQGAVIHGAYWHDSFGKRWSNGCVNVDPTQARELYEWADLGTTVYVQD